MNNKTIAVAVALVVVFGVFFQNFYQPTSGESFVERMDSTPLSLNLIPPIFKNLTLSQGNLSGVGAEAWATFQDYLTAAKNNDLEMVKVLSYQISPACADEARRAECNDLMQGVAVIGQSLEQSDFKNVAYDDKQIVLSTDYIGGSNEAPSTKIALFFVRTTSGDPQVLSIKYCFTEESDLSCVNTDTATRDANKNGWWDSVEALFTL